MDNTHSQSPIRWGLLKYFIRPTMRLAVLSLSTAGLIAGCVWTAHAAWTNAFPAKWSETFSNLVLSAAASFVGSLPLLGVGYLSFKRLKELAQPSAPAPSSEEEILRLMIVDLSSKLVYIRYGHFATEHPKYSMLVNLCHGKEHIWDYHVYIPEARTAANPVAHLAEFFDVDANGVPIAPIVHNSSLIDARPLDKGLQQALIEKLDIHGFSDILITATYQYSKPTGSPIHLFNLEEEKLTIHNIAVFLPERRERVMYVARGMHREVFSAIRTIADPGTTGNKAMIFPSGITSSHGPESVNPLPDAIKLYNALMKKDVPIPPRVSFSPATNPGNSPPQPQAPVHPSEAHTPTLAPPPSMPEEVESESKGARRK